MFGQYNRMGGGLATTILGPVIGEAGTLFDLWNQAKDMSAGEGGHPGKHMASELVNEVLNNVPFGNLFYGRRAFDYLLGDSLREAINPGYLRRRERYVRRESGQTYYLAPSEYHMQTFGR